MFLLVRRVLHTVLANLAEKLSGLDLMEATHAKARNFGQDGSRASAGWSLLGGLVGCRQHCCISELVGTLKRGNVEARVCSNETRIGLGAQKEAREVPRLIRSVSAAVLEYLKIHDLQAEFNFEGDDSSHEDEHESDDGDGAGNNIQALHFQ